MPLVPNEALELAVKNIAGHGDTDIFPFPIENHVFFDKSAEVVALLQAIDKDFEKYRSSIPVLTAKELAVVGQNGFRLGTQIDPIWNAYFLALVISIGEEVEKRRAPATTVFSYRFNPDIKAGTIFDKSVGWQQFQLSAKSHAESHPYVLRCDISDFYSRIYHHRLENALQRAAPERREAVNRIMDLVSAIAAGPSYGLPVGGPAARLLSELLLNGVDRLLTSDGIKFIRFVDDYLIFAKSKESAHSALLRLSQLLLSNEGLSLQKAKTRILTAAEFVATSEFGTAPEGESLEDERARTFRRLRIHYDPYSPTAQSDFMALSDELRKFDIVGMLGRELAKSRIDEGLTRRLLPAIKLLPDASQNDAVRSMLDSLDLLYPLFPSVMLLCRSLLPALAENVQLALYDKLRNLIQSDSYITQVPANLAFALRVLATDPSEETEHLLAAIYKKRSSMMISRDVILIMAHRRADYWLSDCRLTFPTATGWEKRALLIASYVLGDEGKHWRDAVKNDQNSFDRLILEWVAQSKSSKGTSWRVPL